LVCLSRRSLFIHTFPSSAVSDHASTAEVKGKLHKQVVPILIHAHESI
jgi:hypothetical protein